MKRTEIASIILIAAVSIVVSYFLAQWVISLFTKNSDTVDTISTGNQVISSDFNKDVIPTIFNSTAINPTIKTEIK